MESQIAGQRDTLLKNRNAELAAVFCGGASFYAGCILEVKGESRH
jgi:hypothetical protein